MVFEFAFCVGFVRLLLVPPGNEPSLQYVIEERDPTKHCKHAKLLCHLGDGRAESLVKITYIQNPHIPVLQAIRHVHCSLFRYLLSSMRDVIIQFFF